MVIDNYCFGCGIKKVWRDGKTSQVEEKLGEFVSALFQHAEYKKQRELRRKAEELEWERRRKEKQYSEACEKLEKQMLEDLELNSSRLHRSRELKAYIDEVRALAQKQYVNTQYPEDLTHWLVWAENHVQVLNPLSQGILPSYKKATEVIKIEDIH